MKKIKLEHFENLVAVAYADGKLTQEEIDLLAENASRYGLTKEEIEEVIERAEKLQFIIPQNSEDREEQLIESIHMAMIDGEVHEKEYQLCLQIALKLDFDEKYLNNIIELTRKLDQA